LRRMKLGLGCIRIEFSLRNLGTSDRGILCHRCGIGPCTLMTGPSSHSGFRPPLKSDGSLPSPPIHSIDQTRRIERIHHSRSCTQTVKALIFSE
jgi:hypothetical protein